MEFVRNGHPHGRWLIVVLVFFYLLVVFGGASLKDEYSHVSQYISELNAVGSAWDWQIGYLGVSPSRFAGPAVTGGGCPTCKPERDQ